MPQDEALSTLPVLSKQDSALTKETAKVSDLALAKEIAKVQSIERAATLAKWNDYIGFAVSKMAGLTALVVGSIEAVDPSFLSLVVQRPGLVAGVGMALLTGKNIVSLIARLERSSK